MLVRREELQKVAMDVNVVISRPPVQKKIFPVPSYIFSSSGSSENARVSSSKTMYLVFLKIERNHRKSMKCLPLSPQRGAKAR